MTTIINGNGWYLFGIANGKKIAKLVKAGESNDDNFLNAHIVKNHSANVDTAYIVDKHNPVSGWIRKNPNGSYQAENTMSGTKYYQWFDINNEKIDNATSAITTDANARKVVITNHQTAPTEKIVAEYADVIIIGDKKNDTEDPDEDEESMIHANWAFEPNTILEAIVNKSGEHTYQWKITDDIGTTDANNPPDDDSGNPQLNKFTVTGPNIGKTISVTVTTTGASPTSDNGDSTATYDTSIGASISPFESGNWKKIIYAAPSETELNTTNKYNYYDGISEWTNSTGITLGIWVKITGFADTVPPKLAGTSSNNQKSLSRVEDGSGQTNASTVQKQTITIPFTKNLVLDSSPNLSDFTIKITDNRNNTTTNKFTCDPDIFPKQSVRNIHPESVSVSGKNLILTLPHLKFVTYTAAVEEDTLITTGSDYKAFNDAAIEEPFLIYQKDDTTNKIILDSIGAAAAAAATAGLTIVTTNYPQVYKATNGSGLSDATDEIEVQYQRNLTANPPTMLTDDSLYPNPGGVNYYGTNASRNYGNLVPNFGYNVTDTNSITGTDSEENSIEYSVGHAIDWNGDLTNSVSQDNTAPTVTGILVNSNGKDIVLTFSENIEGTNNTTTFTGFTVTYTDKRSAFQKNPSRGGVSGDTFTPSGDWGTSANQLQSENSGNSVTTWTDDYFTAKKTAANKITITLHDTSVDSNDNKYTNEGSSGTPDKRRIYKHHSDAEHSVTVTYDGSDGTLTQHVTNSSGAFYANKVQAFTNFSVTNSSSLNDTYPTISKSSTWYKTINTENYKGTEITNNFTVQGPSGRTGLEWTLVECDVNGIAVTTATKNGAVTNNFELTAPTSTSTKLKLKQIPDFTFTNVNTETGPDTGGADTDKIITDGKFSYSDLYPTGKKAENGGWHTTENGMKHDETYYFRLVCDISGNRDGGTSNNAIFTTYSPILIYNPTPTASTAANGKHITFTDVQTKRTRKLIRANTSIRNGNMVLWADEYTGKIAFGPFNGLNIQKTDDTYSKGGTSTGNANGLTQFYFQMRPLSRVNPSLVGNTGNNKLQSSSHLTDFRMAAYNKYVDNPFSINNVASDNFSKLQGQASGENRNVALFNPRITANDNQGKKAGGKNGNFGWYNTSGTTEPTTNYFMTVTNQYRMIVLKQSFIPTSNFGFDATAAAYNTLANGMFLLVGGDFTRGYTLPVKAGSGGGHGAKIDMINYNKPVEEE